MTAGLEKAGVEVRLGLDMDQSCRDTYEKNNRVRFETVDIRTVPTKLIRDAIGRRGERPLLFVGCAPCQPFSKARKSGVKKHPDIDLLAHFLKVVLIFRPHYVLCENVPQLSNSHNGSRVVDGFLRGIRAAGYATVSGTVNAADFCVPQNRWRLVMMGSRVRDEIRIPVGPTKGNAPTVRHAIADLPPLAAGERSHIVPNHWASNLTQVNLSRIRAVPKDGGDLRSVPTELRPQSRNDFRRYGQGGFFDVYGRMKWDKPAPTLTTRCNSYSNGRYGHPEQDRAISLREAARLQSFNDAYVFHAPSLQEAAKMIGNAVPVNLSYHLTVSLLHGNNR